jgi:hypothetical protein
VVLVLDIGLWYGIAVHRGFESVIFGGKVIELPEKSEILAEAGSFLLLRFLDK